MSSGCLAIVIMNNTVQHISTVNAALSRRVNWNRWLLSQPLMRPCGVVVVRVLGENPPQMALVQDEQVIQALLTYRANPAFSYLWGPIDPSVLKDPVCVHSGGPCIGMMQPTQDRMRNDPSPYGWSCSRDGYLRDTLIQALMWAQRIEVLDIRP
jgi:hypothetical protein